MNRYQRREALRIVIAHLQEFAVDTDKFSKELVQTDDNVAIITLKHGQNGNTITAEVVKGSITAIKFSKKGTNS